MNEQPRLRPPTDPNKSVWRYMNLPKFIWVCERRSLFFCKLSALGDPKEGRPTKASTGGRDKTLNRILPMTEARRYPIGRDLVADAYDAILRLSEMEAREQMYENSWHVNDHESQEMWSQYASDQEGGVCIKSTYQALKDVLPRQCPCRLMDVNYLDGEHEQVEYGNGFNYAVVKDRPEYGFEQEVRAIIWKPNGYPLPFEFVEDTGLVVPVDLNKLIQEVIVRRDSTPEFCTGVEKLVQMHGIRAPVGRSAIG